jgi:EAL domain-containing protein (putative c-di-GMP-specific phosphodiesterase class I)
LRQNAALSARRHCATEGGAQEYFDIYRNVVLKPVRFMALDPGIEVIHANSPVSQRCTIPACWISLDDFGTGYSSLSYLRSFPFDKIKIDRSFITELATREDSMAIVRAVTGLGKSLGIVTTAEGVETDAQFELLRQEGCTQAQGYLFSRPRPAAEVENMLTQPRQRLTA